MTYETDSIFWVEVEKIVPNPYQPRREFDEDKLRELGESIRMYGLLQPLTVTRREVAGEDGSFRTEYELIAGERRLRAAKLMGLQQVPVIIRSDEESEMMKLELAIIENLQREDLNPVDRARAFKQLADQFGLSHTQIAKKMGRSREYVSNSVRLLQLPETILSALQSGDISDGHARTLLMLNGRDEEQDTLFREILLKKLSVREVERLARKVATDKVRKKNWDVDPDILEMEKQLTESLGTRVQISKTDYGGKLVIDYFSPEDLEKLMHIMNNPDDPAVTQQTQDIETDQREIESPPAVPEGSADLAMEKPNTTEVPDTTDMEVAAPAPSERSDVRTESDRHAVESDPIPDSPEVPDVPAAPQQPPQPEHATEEPLVSETEQVSAIDHEPQSVDPTPEDISEQEPENPTEASASTPKKEESDEDLYSIKNFSL